MTARHVKIVINLLIIGLLSACSAQATNTPAPTSAPTEPTAAPTQALVNASAPTDTASPVSPTQTPTETPATQTSTQGATVSFTNDILPIFNNRCANCHGGNRTEEGLNLLSYAAIMSGSKNGAVVSPGDADHSLLVELLLSQEMPKRGSKLTTIQIKPIIDWINQGALNN